MSDRSLDERWMALALALGRRGLGRTWPNPAVGAVVVREEGGQPVIAGRGWTQPGGRPHAEVEALRRAGAAARGATLYVTLEPCSHHGKSPPCADAIIDAGIVRVVSALVDPNPAVAGAGHARLAARGIVVEVGIGAAEALRAHAGHIRRVHDHRPHIMLKLAVSADGKVALAGRRPVAITSSASRNRVHRLRAMYDAVLTGIGTVRADDPLLTCRLPGLEARSPVRVVLDSGLQLPPESRIAMTARQVPVWVMAGMDAAGERERALRACGIDVLRVPASAGKLDLRAAVTKLAERGITRLMIESGPILAGSFLTADLVDEAILMRAPKILGPDAIDALEGLPLEALTQSPRLRLLAVDPIGSDKIEHYERT